MQCGLTESLTYRDSVNPARLAEGKLSVLCASVLRKALMFRNCSKAATARHVSEKQPTRKKTTSENRTEIEVAATL